MRRQLILIALCFTGGLFHPNVYAFLTSFILSFPLTFLTVLGFRYYDKPVWIIDSGKRPPTSIPEDFD
jgi:hypothetical protein